MLEKMKLYEIVRRPLFSEKSSALRDSQKKVLVEVAPWANKYNIALAVKEVFNVDVCAVNIVNCRGKIKRLRHNIGKQKSVKKAYLTLTKGTDVDLFGIVGQETIVNDSKN